MGTGIGAGLQESPGTPVIRACDDLSGIRVYHVARAFTTTMAPMTTGSGSPTWRGNLTDHVPMPPFIACCGPHAFCRRWRQALRLRCPRQAARRRGGTRRVPPSTCPVALSDCRCQGRR